VPKEDPQFWPKLAEQDHFHRDTTLFVDDSLPVLRAARDYGIRFLRAVRLPDSKAPPKETEEFIAIERFDELLEGLMHISQDLNHKGHEGHEGTTC